ncbi:MAG: hypothetical protein KJ561_01350, partial [Nanoarchaeota archaeon]|nr:hypothetical protein [Nanoarchaeota archaeon]
MSRKILGMVVLGILLFSVLSFAAYAALPDLGKVFRAGLSPIENFFKGGWMKYEKTTAFLLFFFLFFSAYLIGMKTAFK